MCEDQIQAIREFKTAAIISIWRGIDISQLIAILQTLGEPLPADMQKVEYQPAGIGFDNADDR